MMSTTIYSISSLKKKIYRKVKKGINRKKRYEIAIIKHGSTNTLKHISTFIVVLKKILSLFLAIMKTQIIVIIIIIPLIFFMC